jgi:hypothetical protein
MKKIAYILSFLFYLFFTINIVAQCSSGSYLDGEICKTCPIGYYCPDGINKKLCEKGKFQNETGRTSCFDCDPGTYNDSLGAVNCKQCLVGTSSSIKGAKECSKCKPGTFQNEKGKLTCKSCAKGKYASDSGAVTCKDCAVGNYNNKIGADSCKLCLAGTYQNKKGSTSCLTCAANTTSYEGGSSCFCFLNTTITDTTICIASAIKGFNINVSDFPYGVFSGENISPSGFFNTDLVGTSKVYYTYEDKQTQQSIRDSFLIKTTTCVEALEIEEDLIFVYPNPFTNGFRIQNEKEEELTISLFTIDGIEKDVIKTSDLTYFYDASNLDNGSYLLQISSTTFSVLKPIVKSSN